MEHQTAKRKEPVVSLNHRAIIEAPTHTIWHLLRQFGAISTWHPDVGHCVIAGGDTSGDGGAVRTLFLHPGDVIHERLLSIDNHEMSMIYGLRGSDVPITDFEACLRVTSEKADTRAIVEWSTRFDSADKIAEARYRAFLQRFVLNGLEGLGAHLGVSMRVDAKSISHAG